MPNIEESRILNIEHAITEIKNTLISISEALTRLATIEERVSQVIKKGDDVECRVRTLESTCAARKHLVGEVEQLQQVEKKVIAHEWLYNLGWIALGATIVAAIEHFIL